MSDQFDPDLITSKIDAVSNPARDEMEEQWEDLVRQDRDCRVYWGAAGCRLERGHDGGHIAPSGSTPDMGLMFGEDTTPEERADME